MATLHLNLLKKWFDLTAQGIKKEEYREITPYWAKRLLSMENGSNLSKCYSKESIEDLCVSLQRWEDFDYIEENLKVFNIKFKAYQNTDFRNGYKSLDKVPRFIIENKNITIGVGKEEWGFTGYTPKFIIHHGKVIEKFNIE